MAELTSHCDIYAPDYVRITMPDGIIETSQDGDENLISLSSESRIKLREFFAAHSVSVADTAGELPDHDAINRLLDLAQDSRVTGNMDDAYALAEGAYAISTRIMDECRKAARAARPIREQETRA